MLIELEQSFIKKFVEKDKQERYLAFLEKPKARSKFTNELHYFKNLNWKLFREISGNESEVSAILAKVKGNKNISNCYAISYRPEFDGKVFSIDEAISGVVGTEDIILIFGNAEIVYYEGEAPNNRYITI
jgi:hypothetical protein